MNNNSLFYLLLFITFIHLNTIKNIHAMGFRSLVALPVEKGGAVARFTIEHSKDRDTLISSAAYGISAKKTLLFGLSYRLSSSANQPQGDLSLLFRQIIYQQDNASGTKRLGLLGGAILSTEKGKSSAKKIGAVFTYLNGRNEIDIDTVYQIRTENQSDTGRYDISWQYRFLPKERPDWGVVKELNSVVELNGRWQEGNTITHQITLGLQQIHKKWLIEGGIAQDINNKKERRYLLSTRFHF